MDLSAYKSLKVGGVELVKLVINGVLAWAKKVYTNLVPLSTDTDGSIYNKVGYKDNARLSSSGGVSSSAQNGSVTTGFMEYTYEAPFIVRMKGALWVDMSNNSAGGNSGTHWYINFYNASKGFLAGIASSGASNFKTSMEATYDATTGVTPFDFSGVQTPTASIDQYIMNGKYIRLNAKGKGADLIVTINEEI